MAELLGHDIGWTLWVKCDLCDEQMMAFGKESVRQSVIAAELRAELESFILAEGWNHLGDVGWLCERCIATRAYPNKSNAEPAIAPAIAKEAIE